MRCPPESRQLPAARPWRGIPVTRGDPLGTVILYAVAVLALIASYVFDRNRTRQAVRKAVGAFMNVLPEFAAVLGLVGLMLTFISPAFIGRVLGAGSGAGGWVLASVIGSITLIPGFVAFPLAASLLEQGAGFGQMAVFVSTLMAVGFVTFPLERRYFGRRAALLRNGMAYVWSFLVALVIVAVVAW